MRHALALAWTTAALAGCAVGPNYRPPPAPATTGYTAAPAPTGPLGPPGAPQTFQPGAPVEADWWRRFGSEELDALVARALTHNADAEAATAALRAAHQAYLAQRGALLPTVDVAGQGSRNRSSAYLQPPLNNNAFVYSLFNAQVNVGYTFDVFGGLRRAVEQSAALEAQQKYQAQGAYLSLTANLVNAYILLASSREQLDVTERLIATNGRLLALVSAQRRLGQSSGLELAAAEAQLDQAEAARPVLQKAIAQQTDLIAALCGESSAAETPTTGALEALSLPERLPVSLPATLVRQRPDLQAAGANVHAASAAVGVALAERLPALTLSGSFGATSGSLASLAEGPNQLWSVAGGLAQPIFRGGSLRHRQRQAEALLDQAKAQYRSVMLSAFQNVGDVLAAVPVDAQAYASAQRGEAATGRQLEIAADQHHAGQTSATPELEAQVAHLQARLTRLQAQAARLGDSVGLFVALGGGWGA